MRYPIPFDLAEILKKHGFGFLDHIVWQKPDGAAIGRGKRFSASRLPLCYKPEPTTEHVLVYRKSGPTVEQIGKTHDDQQAVRESLIEDGYERTDVWPINPATHDLHPAAFPLELAEKVVQYYSIKGDWVLDSFAGVGTTGWAALRNGRRCILIERKKKYLDRFWEGMPS